MANPYLYKFRIVAPIENGDGDTQRWRSVGTAFMKESCDEMSIVIDTLPVKIPSRGVYTFQAYLEKEGEKNG